MFHYKIFYRPNFAQISSFGSRNRNREIFRNVRHACDLFVEHVPGGRRSGQRKGLSQCDPELFGLCLHRRFYCGNDFKSEFFRLKKFFLNKLKFSLGY